MGELRFYGQRRKGIEFKMHFEMPLFDATNRFLKM